MKRLLFYILVLVSVLFVDCGGSKYDELDKIPIKEIKERVNQNSKRIESLEAYGTVAFDSPEQSGQGSIEVRIRKPDSVYISIDGPFGISVLKALITRTDFIYYNVQDNKVITGPSSEFNIGAILRLKVSFDDLINSFSGSFSFEENTDDSVEARQSEGNYLIQVRHNLQKKNYYVEPFNYSMSRYNVTDENEKKLLEVQYSKFSIIENINFPNEINISKPDKNQKIYLSYEQRELNKKDISFRIKYPKSAKVTKWN